MVGRKSKYKLIQTGVFITKEQHKWLQEHDTINFSGFVREKLDELIKNGGNT